MTEDSWFKAAETDSQAAEELAEALAERPPVDLTKLKVALACMLAALLVVAIPLLKPAQEAAVPAAPPPAPVAGVAKASPPAVVAVEKKAKAAPQPKKNTRRVPAKIVARK